MVKNYFSGEGHEMLERWINLIKLYLAILWP